jgi:hypothetical protein
MACVPSRPWPRAEADLNSVSAKAVPGKGSLSWRAVSVASCRSLSWYRLQHWLGIDSCRRRQAKRLGCGYQV